VPKYMFLLYTAPEIREDPAARADFDRWAGYGAALREAGVHVAENPLQGRETATTVRVRDDETLISDGPFAETKEMLGGYYLVDLPSREAAIEWAARVPNAPYGSVEIRPVMELPDRP
jgi:hypothetical protein